RKGADARKGLSLEPVIRCRRENSIAADRLGRAVERVGSGAPHRVMRRRAGRFERRLVAIDLVEIEGVRLAGILQYVEPGTARFVALRAQRVDLDCLEEILPAVRLHPYLHPNRDHFDPPIQRLRPRSSCQRKSGPSTSRLGAPIWPMTRSI